MKKKEIEISVTGCVLITAVNRYSRAIEIAIETKDFQRYIVIHNKKGLELFNHISKVVTVSGIIISKDIDNNSIINVSDFNLTNY